MKYSFNRDKKDLVFAYKKDINASFKDLTIVCNAIRYRSANNALHILDNVINESMPIYYSRFNKGMGSRHELHGRKGRWPKKCAKIIKNILLSTMANAENKGYDPDSMFVIHSAANKTNIIERSPSKGILFISGGYGYAARRRSDLELAKVEIGIGNESSQGLSKKMIDKIKYFKTKAEKSGVQKLETKKEKPLIKSKNKEKKENKEESARPIKAENSNKANGNVKEKPEHNLLLENNKKEKIKDEKKTEKQKEDGQKNNNAEKINNK